MTVWVGFFMREPVFFPPMPDKRDLHSFATLDHDRERRQGFPEVIYSPGKTSDEIAAIAESLFARSGRLLATRATAEQYAAVAERLPQAQYHERGRTIYIVPSVLSVPREFQNATVAIVAAGTSDQPISEEAAITLEVGGIGTVERIYDVGVSGVHRLIERTQDFCNADVVIVVAGMEGALPSVVAGLIKAPVIAVPTSVGYGASFEGIAPLLTMLNSCASGITVVNIDNGFGAAMAAIRIIGSRKKEPN
jgi:NCAIR mutase (PurE)-related protein